MRLYLCLRRIPAWIQAFGGGTKAEVGHGRRGPGACPRVLTHHGVQQRERRQEQERLPRLASHGVVHVVELVDDVVA